MFNLVNYSLHLGDNVYKFDKMLGEGAYAQVYQAIQVEDSEYDLDESEDKVVKVSSFSFYCIVKH